MIGFCRKILDCAQILTMDGGASSLLHWKPRSLASFRVVSSMKRDDLSFKTILDGGANVGQFARAASWAFPQAKIHSFEPLPDIADQLALNLKDLNRVEVHRTALGEIDGTIEFHRSERTQESSILKSSTAANRTVDTFSVPICRLDTWAATKSLEGPMLLKLDLQGYELPALKGADDVLARSSHVLVEAIFEDAYEGEPPFEELWKFLNSRNFKFVRPVAANQDITKGVMQFDALFSRNR